MTKHEIMKAYVEEKVMELVGSLTSFNFANDSPDSISFLTNYAGKIVEKCFFGKEQTIVGNIIFGLSL